MHSQRLDILKDNEKHVADGGEFEDADSDDVNDIGDENANDVGGNDAEGFVAVDSDEEWEEQQKLYARMGAKLTTGKKLSADEMKEFGIDDDDDDSSDEDYEYNGGDMNLYDSRIDDVDELKTLKDTLL